MLTRNLGIVKEKTSYLNNTASFTRIQAPKVYTYAYIRIKILTDQPPL